MFKLVVLSALLALASAKPHVLTPVAPVAYAAHSVAVAPAVAQVTKTVHYASEPVVTGYSSTILKPNLGLGLATPSEIVSHERVLAPARAVHTITPHITEVQPEIHVQNVPVEVPVHTPVAVVKSAPIVAAAPAVAVVKSVPTSVSHQSSTVVHSSANVVEAVAPAVYSAPAVVSSYGAPIYGARAVYGSPVAVSSYSTHGLVNTHGVALSHAAPLVSTW